MPAVTTYATRTPALSGLPDPETQAAFYEHVPLKRFIAWIIDTALISLLTGLIVILSVFTMAFFLPLVFLLVNAIYRYVTLAGGSATPGMRLMALELRTHRGTRFDRGTAAAHTAGYLLSVSMVLPQIISIALMLTTARAQGLTDCLLGTAAINRVGRR